MQQYEYFAVVTPARPRPEDPAIMLRRWVDENGQVREESFTTRLTGAAWAPSTVLSNPAVSSSDVHRVDERAAVRYENALRGQLSRGETYDGRPYSYLAWLDGSTVDDPTGVLRTWTTEHGGEGEQRYLPGTGWRDSYVREDWRRGRYDGTFEPIDKATADKIVERWEQRRTEQG
ncbi:hypothetical protein [Nocardia sp. NRRL S-836]|uniref:hypothetical protein n=1 Tax=Nocardia sp. NRRL S-836 TaxID=1519492 RepID=UPI0006AF22DE|nr:hypothetical protein [Nocardia sp. NRRL S-836]KOV80393.1 hypothetical protein ADL03_33655 [Nocardia sp. NRRL S-836]